MSSALAALLGDGETVQGCCETHKGKARFTQWSARVTQRHYAEGSARTRREPWTRQGFLGELDLRPGIREQPGSLADSGPIPGHNRCNLSSGISGPKNGERKKQRAGPLIEVLTAVRAGSARKRPPQLPAYLLGESQDRSTRSLVKMGGAGQFNFLAYKPRSPSPSSLLRSLPFTALRFSSGKKKPRVRGASGAPFSEQRLPAPAATTVTVSAVPVTPAVAPTGVP